jgi:hypothetical protein
VGSVPDHLPPQIVEGVLRRGSAGEPPGKIRPESQQKELLIAKRSGETDAQPARVREELLAWRVDQHRHSVARSQTLVRKPQRTGRLAASSAASEQVCRMRPEATQRLVDGNNPASNHSFDHCQFMCLDRNVRLRSCSLIPQQVIQGTLRAACCTLSQCPAGGRARLMEPSLLHSRAWRVGSSRTQRESLGGCGTPCRSAGPSSIRASRRVG